MGRVGRFGSCDFTTPKKLVTNINFDLQLELHLD